MTMTQLHLLLQIVGAGFAIVAALYGAINSAVVAKIKYEIQGLKTEIAEHRAADKQELRDWINGSFMRSGEANAKLDAIESRVTHLEHRRA